MEPRRTRTLTILVLIAALAGFTFLVPVPSYAERSSPILSNWSANVEPTWTQLSRVLLLSQIHIGIQDPSSPSGLHYVVLEAVPVDSQSDLNGTVAISGEVQSSPMSSYNFYVFNTSTLASWQGHETPTPYFFAMNISNLSFHFFLTSSEATSNIFFVIEANGNNTDATIQAAADYVVRGGIHRILLSASGPRVPIGSKDLVLHGEITTVNGSNKTLFTFYSFDTKTFATLESGQREPSSVPALFKNTNATTGFAFTIPLTESYEGSHFVIESPAFLGPPVRALLSVELQYKENVQKTTAQYILDAAADSPLASSPVAQSIRSFAASIYPQLYLLGAIIIFALFLALIQVFVFVGFGTASESRILRGFDTLRDKLENWARRRLAKPKITSRS